MFSNMDIIGA